MPVAPEPFVIFTLPRSRSTWLSVLLSSPGALVGHDIGIECSTAAEFLERLSGLAGTCETGAAFAWRAIRDAIPHVKMAVVWRSPTQVIESLKRQGFTDIEAEIVQRGNQMLALAREPHTHFVTYDDLATFEACDALHRFCLDRPLDPSWWEKMHHTNVQIDLPWQLSRLMANRDSIERLKAEVRGSMDALPDRDRAVV